MVSEDEVDAVAWMVGVRVSAVVDELGGWPRRWHVLQLYADALDEVRPWRREIEEIRKRVRKEMGFDKEPDLMQMYLEVDDGVGESGDERTGGGLGIDRADRPDARGQGRSEDHRAVGDAEEEGEAR